MEEFRSEPRASGEKIFTVTTPIFYVNARPHIGHAYSVVAADVLARYRRLQGDTVFFLTGTDEHGTKIAEAAAAAGHTPQAFADATAQTFRDAWRALDISHDDFIRTTEPRHAAGVTAALKTLRDKGFLLQKAYRGRYCTGCETFVTEKDLTAEGKCPQHQRVPEVVEEQNWFFSLQRFLPAIRSGLEKGTFRVEPAERRNEVLGLLTHGLEDFSVSRSRERVPWGIPVPFDDSQTVYVWVDALLNYLTALGFGSAAPRENLWPADVQIIGQDILKFHAVYWPALLLALDLPLPRTLVVHGFFTIDGQKVSKSLGNVLDPQDLVRRYGSDATRYLLLSQFPLGTSGDVQSARFDEQYDAVLANTIGNLVSRTIALLQKFAGGTIPDAVPDPKIVAELEAYRTKVVHPNKENVGAIIDALVRVPVELAVFLNQYVDRVAPWKERDQAKLQTALRTLVEGLVVLGVMAEPVLPRASRALRQALACTPAGALETRARVTTTDPPLLFPRAKDLLEKIRGRDD